MENPFKKILRDEKLPEYLKDRVIDNLNVIKLTIDVSELYAVQVPQALESLMSQPDVVKQEELIRKIIKENYPKENE
ncbi:hypothetical protein [Myroides sp. LJL119]